MAVAVAAGTAEELLVDVAVAVTVTVAVAAGSSGCSKCNRLNYLCVGGQLDAS